MQLGAGKPASQSQSAPVSSLAVPITGLIVNLLFRWMAQRKPV
jgi:hypothetical protein